MDYAHLTKPKLAYRYEFELDEVEEAQACVEAHGFAILKRVLQPEMVEALKASVMEVVNPNNDMGPGQSRTHTYFIEQSPALWRLLEDETFLRVQRIFCQAEELTINRTAAIIRNPGSAALVWHSDWRGFSTEPPRTANDVLNRGLWPSGLWFYLTGS